MIHRSGLDAWSIRLIAQAARNNKNMIIQANIQYLEIAFLNIMVDNMAATNHNKALKRKGGSGKINWKRFKTITIADKTGYFNTA
jgi:hypothetical protein